MSRPMSCARRERLTPSSEPSWRGAIQGQSPDQVERPLLAGAEQRGERPVDYGDVRREPTLCKRPLTRPLPCEAGVAPRFSQAEPGRSRRRSPDRIGGPGQYGVGFQRKKADRGRAPDEPPRLPQPGLVRREQQQGARQITIPEPAHALAERRAFGGDAAPDDPHAAAIGQRDRGVQRMSPVPAEADRMRGIGRGGGDAVDA